MRLSISQPTLTTLQTDWLPSILLSLFMFATSVTGFFMAIFFSENLNFSATEIGILFAAQSVTGVLAALPAGISNDRLTSKVLIIIALVMQAIGYLMMAIATSFLPYLVIFFAWSLANNIFRVSMDVQVLKTDTKENTGRRIGLYQGWRFTGLTLGTVTAAYLLARFNFKVTLIAVGVACMALILLATHLVPTPVSKIKLSDYHEMFKSPKALFFAGWMLLFATHWGAEMTCYGLFLRQSLKLTMIETGYYMSCEFAAIIFTMCVLGPRVNSTLQIKTIAMIGLIASGIGNIGMTFEPALLSVFFRAIHGIGDGCMTMVFYFGITRLFNIQRLGGNTGLMTFATMFGSVIGSLVYSPMGEKLGYAHPIWISGIITLLLTLPFFIASKNHAISLPH